MSWQHFEGHLRSLLVAVAFSLVAQPASAQLLGSRSVEATGCASAIGGNVRDSTITTVCGMPPNRSWSWCVSLPRPGRGSN